MKRSFVEWSSRCLPAIAALLVILHCHTPFYTQAHCTDVDDGTDNHWLPPKYFARAIKDDADNFIIVDPQLSCTNETSYEILNVTLLDMKDHIVPYWDKTQILLKIPSSSSLVSPINDSDALEYNVCMSVHIRCVTEYYLSLQHYIGIKLRPLSVQLVPEPLIFEQPFNFTCRVIGHVPEQSNGITVTYHRHRQSSSDGIQNCTKSPAFTTYNSYKSFNYSCTVTDRATLSNMGDYFCTVKIEDNTISSAVATVELNRKVIEISTGVSSGVAVLVVAVVILAFIGRKIKIRCQNEAARRHPVQVEHGDEEEHGLLHREDENGIRDQRAELNQAYGAIHNPLEDRHRQRAEANLDPRLEASGRHTPGSARSAGGSAPDYSVHLSDHGGYESAV